VTVGISPTDGLMRVLTATLATEKVPPPVSTVIFQSVQRVKVAADSLKLPADAAEARWVHVNGDKRQAIPTPAAVISPKKP